MHPWRSTIPLTVILTLTGCAAADTPPAVPTVTFNHYGPIAAGMSREELLAATPVHLDQYGGNSVCSWLADSRHPPRAPYGELHVTLDREGTVVGIDAPASAWTDLGITVGSSRDQVVAAYGEPVEEGTNEEGDFLLYGSSEKGWLGFNLNSSDAVVTIRTGSEDYARGGNICSEG
ncbi:hypothetical protein [Micromonospora sp. NPDC004704]